MSREYVREFAAWLASAACYVIFARGWLLWGGVLLALGFARLERLALLAGSERRRSR